MSDDPKVPEILYFDGPGRANLARLAFVVGNVPFKDTRINFEEWPAIKSDPTSVQASLFGSMPCLKHDSVMLAESVAIATYAAELGIYTQAPTPSPSDRSMDIMVACAHESMRVIMYKCLFGSDESKAKGLEELPKAAAPILEGLERIYSRKKTPGPFLLREDKPTLADLAMLDMIESPFPGLKALKVVDLSPYPKVAAASEAVGKIPAIETFVKNGFKLST